MRTAQEGLFIIDEFLQRAGCVTANSLCSSFLWKSEFHFDGFVMRLVIYERFFDSENAYRRSKEVD